MALIPNPQANILANISNATSNDTLFPTSYPTNAPSPQPTTTNQFYENIRWRDILSIFIYQLVFGGILLVLFEVCRSHAKNIYYPRRRWDDRAPPQPPSLPLAWIPAVLSMPGEETLDRVGLDAFMLLRFLKLCTQLTLVYSFFGCVILVPVYSRGEGGFRSFNKYTMNNLTTAQGLWLPTTFAVLFTLYSFFRLRQEYENFTRWRIAFLSEGSVDSLKFQGRYTILIEGLPKHVRTNRALEDFLDDIFPGQVFTCNVQYDLGALERLHDQRLKVVNALEKAVAYHHVTGKVKRVRVKSLSGSMFGERVEAVPHYRALLAELNERALEIQKTVLAYQRRPQEESVQRATGLKEETKEIQLSPRASNDADEKKLSLRSRVSNVGKLLIRQSSGIEVAMMGPRSSVVRPKKAEVAFATLTSELATCAAASGFLVAESNTLLTRLAPEAEDVIWGNIYISRWSRNIRASVAYCCYLVLGLFWGALVSLFSTAAVASGDFLLKAGVKPSSLFFAVVTRYLPVTLQLGVLALLPVCVQFTGSNWEGIISNSELQGVVFSRYFLFQLVNIIVTIGSISAFVFWREYGLNDVPTLIVNTFPRVGAYFVEQIIVKTMFGFTWELARAWPCIQMLFATTCSDKRQWTNRSLRAAYLSCPEFLYGWIYPSCLSVIVISMTYAVVSPLVSAFALVFFLVAEVVYKNNALFVYTSTSNSGGAMWNSVFKRLVVGLAFAHFLLSCYLLVKEAFVQVGLLFLCMVADAVFLRHCYRVYEWPSAVVPLSVAAKKDRFDLQSTDRCGFSTDFYRQPALRLDPVLEEPFLESPSQSPLSFANSDSVPMSPVSSSAVDTVAVVGENKRMDVNEEENTPQWSLNPFKQQST